MIVVVVIGASVIAVGASGDVVGTSVFVVGASLASSLHSTGSFSKIWHLGSSGLVLQRSRPHFQTRFAALPFPSTPSLSTAPTPSGSSSWERGPEGPPPLSPGS